MSRLIRRNPGRTEGVSLLPLTVCRGSEADPRDFGARSLIGDAARFDPKRHRLSRAMSR
jgi:hypothetical protein